MTHFPCSTQCRKRVGCIRSSIAGSVAEYSTHGIGVGVCSNELEDIACLSLRNFMRGGGRSLVRSPVTTITHLSSHGLALLQVQRFCSKISFWA